MLLVNTYISGAQNKTIYIDLPERLYVTFDFEDGANYSGKLSKDSKLLHEDTEYTLITKQTCGKPNDN